jgi:murein DD-endopeptidase MepM/ murein hydrolase activator NlpD
VDCRGFPPQNEGNDEGFSIGYTNYMKLRVSLGLGLAAVLGACAVQNNPAPVTGWGGGASAGTIVVASGDTLSVIAKRYGLDYQSLAAANHLAPPYRIYAGEALNLPASPWPARQTSPTPPRVAAAVSAPRPAPVTEPVREGASAKASPPRSVELAEASPPPLPTPPPSLRIDSPELPPLAHPLGPPPPSLRRVEREAAAPKPKPRPVEVAMREPAQRPEPPRTEAPPSPVHPVQRAVGQHGFIWPVRGRVIEGFGPGPHGIRNDGINIAARRGAPVLAAASGTVVYVGNQLRGYGNLILLKHDDGYLTAYAHNETMLVRNGQRVVRGQVIARVGETGGVSEPQLHFEIRDGTKPIDPARFLPAREQVSDAD